MKRIHLVFSFMAILFLATLAGCRSEDQKALDRMVANFNNSEVVKKAADGKILKSINAEARGNDLYVDFHCGDDTDFSFLKGQQGMIDMTVQTIVDKFLQGMSILGNSEDIQVLRRLGSNIIVRVYDGKDFFIESIIPNRDI